MEWSFSSAGPVEAHVAVPAGVVEIQPSLDGQVVVSLEGDSRWLANLVEHARVTLTGNVLVVDVPHHVLRSGSVNALVTIPEGSSLEYRSASAELRCAVELARLDARTASAGASVPAVTGDVEFSTASGDLECGDIGGRLVVKSASGDVSVRRVGRDVQISQASGDVEVGEVGGSLRASTASGDVRIGRASAGRINANTASGDVAIGVAAGVGAYLDVTSVTGDMECDLPFEEQHAGTAQLEIVCRTVSGDVRIEAAR